MCGIGGMIHFRGAAVNVPAGLALRECLAHRGPDDFGAVALAVQDQQPPIHFAIADEYYRKNPVSAAYSILFVHRRLSIIDLSAAGHQPMMNHARNLTLTFNGELYNYQELRNILKKRGYLFHSQTDSEVILQAYLEWGTDCLQHFEGMFAFALWDHRRQALFCARDRFGEKPFYYYFAPDQSVLVFASELTALVQYPGVPQQVDPAALNGYLALGYILAPRTWYTGIYKLPPAHYLWVDYAQPRILPQCYWHYEAYFRRKSHDPLPQAAENVLGLLTQAVKQRLVADVPVGVFLSGGLDSSAVAVLAQQQLAKPLQAFSLGFHADSYNELPAAQRLAQWAHLQHYLVHCELNLDQMAQALQAFDEPFADNALLPLWALSAVTAQQVKVVLSGDGADEVFAGYPTYKASRLQHWAQWVPSGLKRLGLELLQRYPLSPGVKMGWAFKCRQFLQGSQYPEDQAHYAWRLIFNPEARVRLLGESWRELVYETDPWHDYQRYYQQAQDLAPLDRHLFVDAKTWLADDVLVKTDRASLSHGLEARCPYLDQALVCYVASLPAHYKLAGWQEKYILKQALQAVLPPFVLKRPKTGFNAPVGQWLTAMQAVKTVKTAQNPVIQNEFQSFTYWVWATQWQKQRQNGKGEVVNA